MRNIITLTVVFSVLICVFSGCSNKDKKPHIISVIGVGEVKAVPDTVVFSFRIESLDKDLNKAQNRNNRIIRRLKSVAKSFKIAAKDISTEYVNIGPRYEMNKDDKQEFKGYEAGQYVEITLRDQKQYDDFLQSAMKTGVTELNSIDKKLDKKKEYELKAKVLAVKDAKGKAVQLARKAGVQIGKPIYINEICSQHYEYSYETNLFGNAGNSRSTYSPGQDSIKACVKMHFELK